jgi:hypothetical protein
LHDLPQPLTWLSVNGLESGDLSPLNDHADSLENLYIHQIANIQDITPLLRLPKLACLALDIESLMGVAFVRDLPKLRTLSLRGLINVTDLSPLLIQDSLEDLRVDNCPGLTDLDALPPLESVIYLSLSGSSLGSNVRGLAERAPKLSWLDLKDSLSVDGLEQLAALALDHLGLWGCRGITSFDFLAGFPGLNYLDLEDTNIGELEPISGLASLRTLWLRGCADVADLTPLSSLRNLRDLHIEGVAPAIDLAPLASIPRVTIHIRRGQQVQNRARLGRKVKENQT